MRLSNYARPDPREKKSVYQENIRRSFKSVRANRFQTYYEMPFCLYYVQNRSDMMMMMMRSNG